MKKQVSVFIINFIVFIHVQAQVRLLPLQNDYSKALEVENLLNDSFPYHNFIQPTVLKRVKTVELNRYDEKEYKGKFKRKALCENLISVKDTSEGFFLNINPVFHFEGGLNLLDTLNEKLYNNTRGIHVSGNAGEKIYFESTFYENQATYLSYIDDFNKKYLVVPGMGRWKKYKLNGYDFAMSSGRIVFAPVKKLYLHFGHGKNFIGHGYRSLLLSDNTFNYPFFRVEVDFKKVYYSQMYTLFMNISKAGIVSAAGIENLFQKKPASFQILNYKPVKWLNISAFQAMLAPASDSLNNLNLTGSYFIPVPLVNLFKYKLNHQNNNLIGGGLMLQLPIKVIAYAQMVLDNFSFRKKAEQKWGFQSGVKFYNLFRVKNLFVQVELNRVAPFTYSHISYTQNYAHYNQSLAHPLGANFIEYTAIAGYVFKRWYLDLKMSVAKTGLNIGKLNYGQDIFIQDYANNYSAETYFLQGELHYIVNQTAQLGYRFNKAYNAKIYFGLHVREISRNTMNTSWIYCSFGIKTNLYNIYHDF